MCPSSDSAKAGQGAGGPAASEAKLHEAAARQRQEGAAERFELGSASALLRSAVDAIARRLNGLIHSAALELRALPDGAREEDAARAALAAFIEAAADGLESLVPLQEDVRNLTRTAESLQNVPGEGPSPARREFIAGLHAVLAAVEELAGGPARLEQAFADQFGRKRAPAL